MNKLKCYECKGHCNKKGYPSISKGSAFCEANRGVISEFRASLWGRIREKMLLRGWVK